MACCGSRIRTPRGCCSPRPHSRWKGKGPNTWLALHTFAAGFTDRFTLGGGLAWFPGVGLDEAFYYLLPKYTLVNGKSTRVAVGDEVLPVLELQATEVARPRTALAALLAERGIRRTPGEAPTLVGTFVQPGEGVGRTRPDNSGA